MVVSGFIRFGWFGLVVAVPWYAWMVCFSVRFIGGKWADGSVVSGYKVRIYKEYHSVCSLVGIGTLPTPLSPASLLLPPEPGGGRGHTRLRVGGWGGPNSDDWRKSLALCLLCVSGYSFLLLQYLQPVWPNFLTYSTLHSTCCFICRSLKLRCVGGCSHRTNDGFIVYIGNTMLKTLIHYSVRSWHGYICTWPGGV